MLATKFIFEEDADALQKELKEAFRLYDKDGNQWLAWLHQVYGVSLTLLPE